MTNVTHFEQIDCSIVVPVYYNEGSLSHMMESILDEVIKRNPQFSYEIIFVDDGSGDGSMNELIDIWKSNPKMVKVVKLSRNFGQISALMAGFSQAKGKCVIAMCADGQDPASLVNDMLKAYLEEGFEIVVCQRRKRVDSTYRIITSRIFYGLIKKLTFPNLPVGGFDFFLLGERSIEIILRNREQNPFIQGQVLWLGFKTKFIEYERMKRVTGKSRWTFARKLTYLIDAVMSYSFFPIRLMSYTGVMLALMGFLYALIVLFTKLFLGNPIAGWAPLMIVILVVGGFQMVMLGVIGEYLWRVLSQVRKRDLYVIDKIYDKIF